MLLAEHTHTNLNDVHVLNIHATGRTYTLYPFKSWAQPPVGENKDPYEASRTTIFFIYKERGTRKHKQKREERARKGEKGGLRKGSCKQKEQNHNGLFAQKSLLVQKKVLLRETRILKTDFSSQKNSNMDIDTHTAVHLCSSTLWQLSSSTSFLPGRVSETSSAGKTDYWVLVPLRLLCACVCAHSPVHV